jgi:hypothetical protein
VIVPWSVAVDCDHAGAAVKRSTAATTPNTPTRARKAGRIDHPPCCDSEPNVQKFEKRAVIIFEHHAMSRDVCVGKKKKPAVARRPSNS